MPHFILNFDEGRFAFSGCILGPSQKQADKGIQKSLCLGIPVPSIQELKGLFAWTLSGVPILSRGGGPPNPPATKVSSSFLARSLWAIKDDFNCELSAVKDFKQTVSTGASCTLILKLQLSLISKKLKFSALESSGLLSAHQWYKITSAGHALENANLIGFTISHSSWGKGKVEINCGLVSVLSVFPGLH